ncbi:SusC/RagA family TonB-linked outer membrane protein [Niabella drilacis]|uniref:TonB-linked outer membrane protein, SusC/RagA family n=1 Tax=Niabella drilacis (strain DSM 25811 / CCM 8410 / CCUG 62505 / LMG 26954 / E90) TaxID=1285928 RepID=A0A1G6JIB9_NIADE|nr:SusC/RagA family TonB-linked outer membrane protein [Niabella drilacis]SDC18388.1 TonB-linked outer membrane protein, SusC/RagA family [Niabella drilacis]
MKKLIATIKITLLSVLMLVCSGMALYAQDPVLVKGTVVSPSGIPIPGASINSANGKNGTVADKTGEYILQVNDKSATITISADGYQRQTVKINPDERMNVILQPDPHHQDEEVDLGYTQQLRKEVSGAVSTVKGAVLERAPVANFTQTLAGRLAGLTTIEVKSELSKASTDLYSRGVHSTQANGPLVVIDGIPVAYKSSESLNYISANEIESVSLLKDASTQAIYGIRGANGVLVITTKRGIKTPLIAKVTFDQSMQEATTRPVFISSAEYAELRNQAAMNDSRPLPFTQQQIEKYKAGNDPAFPNNNWYNMFMKDFALMQRGSVNLTGGNDRVQFYSNVNVMHQGGYFKTDQEKYNPNTNNVWVNYRTNVDMVINKYIKTFVRLAGNVKRERTPGVSNAAVYSSLFNMPPVAFGPVTPKITDSTGKVTDPGKVLATQNADPTYGLLNRSGYWRTTTTNTTSQFGVDADLGFLTKGLKASGIFAYQTNSAGGLNTFQGFERWLRPLDKDTLILLRGENTPLVYGKLNQYYYHLSYKGMLNYARVFGKHAVTGMGYMFFQNLTKANTDAPWLLPYNRFHTGGEITYGYDNRYYAKVDLGYSGSEQYGAAHRYAATPAGSVAWVLSNETFLKSQQWLSLLKLRASYGKAGNDESGLNRYAYLNEIRFGNGGPVQYLQYNIDERTRANPNIGAELLATKNLGIDLGLFHKFSITADIFHERMDNMVVSATGLIPAYQGVPLNDYPMFNTGRFENKGYEISVDYHHAIGPDLKFNIGGMYSYNKNTVVHVNEPVLPDEYVYRHRVEGLPLGQAWVFRIDRSNGNGYFNTQEELNNNTIDYTRVGAPRLGDFKYTDLNKNGKIDDGDAVPVGTGMIPRKVYAFSGGLQYKAVELNVQFQGIGQYTTLEGGAGVWESGYDGIFGSLHRNAWTRERYEQGLSITAPALTLGSSSSMQPTDYVAYDRSYLRLKNVELAYTFPAAAAKLIGAENIRFLLSGQNLVTWDHMKSKDFGPEGSGYTGFPAYRVYNMGVKVTF